MKAVQFPSLHINHTCMIGRKGCIFVSPKDITEHFHGAVTVGERGQVVIPASVREFLEINPGDKLLVFAHPSGSGVMFAKLQDLQRMSEIIAAIDYELKSADAEPATELPEE